MGVSQIVCITCEQRTATVDQTSRIPKKKVYSNKDEMVCSRKRNFSGGKGGALVQGDFLSVFRSGFKAQ